MSAGMPGLGLGGLFFVLSALAAPLLELPRAVRGESRPGAWREIGRNLSISLLVIAAVDIALRIAFLLAWLLGSGTADRVTQLSVLPLGPVAVTGLILAGLLAGAKLAQLGFQLVGLMGIRAARRRRRLVHGPSCPCCG